MFSQVLFGASSKKCVWTWSNWLYRTRVFRGLNWCDLKAGWKEMISLFFSCAHLCEQGDGCCTVGCAVLSLDNLNIKELLISSWSDCMLCVSPSCTDAVFRQPWQRGMVMSSCNDHIMCLFFHRPTLTLWPMGGRKCRTATSFNDSLCWSWSMVNASATVDECAPNGLYKRPKEGHEKTPLNYLSSGQGGSTVLPTTTTSYVKLMHGRFPTRVTNDNKYGWTFSAVDPTTKAKLPKGEGSCTESLTSCVDSIHHTVITNLAHDGLDHLIFFSLINSNPKAKFS